jgi:acetyltransferase
MSIRNLDAIFRPASVALIGASPKPGSVGRVIADNLLATGFSGPIMPVNPKYPSIRGVIAYPDVAHLPVTPDLAVICTPPATVPGLVGQLGDRGVKGAVVITAGFKELGSAAGRALEQAILDAARPHLLRIVGPNCVGTISTAANLNASFAHLQPQRGGVAFVTQSGAMATTVLDWAAARGIGFSHVVSLGDMTDVDFGDMLDYLATDPGTTAILLYIEAITAPRKFMSAARAAARLKPVIAIKAGRYAAAARAAASHTGALAGVDAVYAAAFRRAGILRVNDLDEVFDAVETLAARTHSDGDRLAILTNGGGVGVLATDALIEQGGLLADLSSETVARLDAKLPPTWSHGNPVDIIGDAKADRYTSALNILLAAPEIDAVLTLNCPTALASGADAAAAVVDSARQRPGRILTSWLGSTAAAPARQLFAAADIPTYDTPEKAVRGFMHLVRHRRNQKALMEAPPSTATGFVADRQAAKTIVEAAAARGNTWLDAVDVGGVLEAYGISTPKLAFADGAEEAVAAARAIGTPVALKIVSPQLLHKSDVGGVALDLNSADEVEAAAKAMLERVKAKAPAAAIRGFIVQEMVHRNSAHELILGMTVDAQFGPVLLFGHGGTAVEVIDDKALALPPLNLTLAHEMIARTRVYRQLRGYRDRAAADLDAIALTLVKLSHMVSELDEVVELDINPLLADADGVMALDARIRVAPAAADVVRGQRLAIRPYPRELERLEALPGLGQALLRPVRPGDEPAFLRLFHLLSPEDVRLRFFAPLHELPRTQLVRLTQIDYDREMAFVLEALEGDPRDIFGVVRIAADPDNQKAEFALTVRSDLKGRGIGTLLLRRMLDYANTRGIGEVFGDILSENSLMLGLCRELGFTLTPLTEDEGIVRAVRRP